jgi:hypothetical protein
MPICFTDHSNSGVPAGTLTIFFDLSRWLRFAPPPANFRRPSGAENNFAEFASSIRSERAFASQCSTVRDCTLEAMRTQLYSHLAAKT